MPVVVTVELGLVRRLEGVERSSTVRIAGIGHLDYWRRRERYQIVYLYKMMTGEVPSFEHARLRIAIVLSERRGRSCGVPPIN